MSNKIQLLMYLVDGSPAAREDFQIGIVQGYHAAGHDMWQPGIDIVCHVPVVVVSIDEDETDGAAVPGPGSGTRRFFQQTGMGIGGQPLNKVISVDLVRGADEAIDAYHGSLRMLCQGSSRNAPPASYFHDCTTQAFRLLESPKEMS